MILVLGGAASGKRAWVKTLGYTEADMADAQMDERPVLYNLQALVARDPANADAFLEALLEKRVVICNEVGSGVIPAAPQMRETREAVGRLCILLAQCAEKVVRMVCGIPAVIREAEKTV